MKPPALNGTATRVLLVDDDSIQVTLIARLLERDHRQHFAVVTAGRLSGVPSLLESGGIDVILLDLGLPDSQGIQTVRAVRACAHRIPIIVLTGCDDEEMALDTLKNGAQDYLVKSAVDGPLLTRSIRYAIQRHESDQVMNEQRQRLQFLMESIPDVQIYFKDKAGRFIDANPAVAKTHGFDSPKELIGKSDFDIFGREHAAETFEDEQRVIHTRRPLAGKVEKEPTSDGTSRWVLTTKMPLYGEDGEVIGTCGITRDITALKHAQKELVETNRRLNAVVGDLQKSHEELKATQMQLIQAEKLQSLGQMAAGVAHEVKNPLAILHMGMECLADSLSVGDEQMKSVVAEMNRALQRAETIVRDMLDYSAAKDLALERIALNSLINQTLRMVRYELSKHKVKVVTRFAEGLPELTLDATKIEQVLVNVFTNACQAMPDGGTLTITTRGEVVGSGDLEDQRFGAFQQSETLAIIEICDTGSGIPGDKLCHIFDPFFTTKARGTGTGLGLSVVRKIIELHGGTISIANAPEGGARVTVVLKYPSVSPSSLAAQHP